MSILLVACATCISTILASLIEQCRLTTRLRFLDETFELDNVSDAVAQAKVVSDVGVEYIDGSRLTAKRFVAKRVEVTEGIFPKTSLSRGFTFCPDSSFLRFFELGSMGHLRDC